MQLQEGKLKKKQKLVQTESVRAIGRKSSKKVEFGMSN